MRRKIAKPDELTFDLTLAPATAALPDLVRVAGTRRTAGACFEAATGEVGLDQYEVRSWAGWHRHITPAMLAPASPTVVPKAAAIGGRRGARSLDAELLPLSVPEVRRLVRRLVWARPPDPVPVPAWSTWRRRHQQRARRRHWQRRLRRHQARL